LHLHQQFPPQQITGEVDRVYAHGTDNDIPDITLAQKSCDASGSGNYHPFLTVKKTARLEEPFATFEQVPADVVFWNPWSEKAAALADMDDDGYTKYVCVEPGTVANWVTVPPGKALVLTQVLCPVSSD
jgi:hypothetical protein